ncbi:MAG: hypothetical protein ACFFAN_18865 [Promethearchaeota archaeon]
MNKRNIEVIILVINFTIFIFSSSIYSNQNQNSNIFNEVNKDNNRKIKTYDFRDQVRNLQYSGKPGNFTLSSNAYFVEEEESFILSWTSSDGADNYSLYYSAKAITKIDGNSTLIVENLTNHSYKITKIHLEITYYVAVAYNESGKTLSNYIEIRLNYTEEDDNDDDTVFFAMVMEIRFFILILILLIITFFATVLISIKYSGKKPKFQPEPNYKFGPRSSISSSKNRKNAQESREIEGKIKNIKKKVLPKSSKELLNEKYDNRAVLTHLKDEISQEHTEIKKKIEITSISNEILNKIDKFKWKSEDEKLEFINEMLALSPKEREEILDFMLKKAKDDELID